MNKQINKVINNRKPIHSALTPRTLAGICDVVEMIENVSHT